MSIPKELFHHRWSLPILVELDARRGAKFVTLSRSLGVGRGTLRQTLDALQSAGLVERNPGHGHPLRPEYVLTSEGAAVAQAGRDLLRALESEGLEELGLRKWTLAVLVALAEGDRHFGTLRERLLVSPRALALTLKDLVRADLVERRIRDGFPPTTEYVPTPGGDELARLAERL